MLLPATTRLDNRCNPFYDNRVDLRKSLHRPGLARSRCADRLGQQAFEQLLTLGLLNLAHTAQALEPQAAQGFGHDDPLACETES